MCLPKHGAGLGDVRRGSPEAALVALDPMAKHWHQWYVSCLPTAQHPCQCLGCGENISPTWQDTVEREAPGPLNTASDLSDP